MNQKTQASAATPCDTRNELIEKTKDEYLAFQRAKRVQYNAQRRLDNACRKAAA